jgi:hypothetical protein
VRKRWGRGKEIARGREGEGRPYLGVSPTKVVQKNIKHCPPKKVNSTHLLMKKFVPGILHMGS